MDYKSNGIASLRMGREREDEKLRRNELILRLLTELTNEYRSDGLSDSVSHLDYEDDAATADERWEQQGVETFQKFKESVKNLQARLTTVANAAQDRYLASSIRTSSSAHALRDRLIRILHLFQENSVQLFPDIGHPDQATGNEILDGEFDRNRRRNLPEVRNPPIFGNIDPGTLPQEMRHCALEFKEFLECVDSPIVGFVKELDYWAGCIEEYKDRFKERAVQQYLHDLSCELAGLMDIASTSLSTFIDVGIPAIELAQKHQASNILNMSTVATLFSGVSATTLQFSFERTDGPTANAVNAFWFTSLVFSIAAAVNSLLNLTYNQSIHRTPRHRLPWWVLMWIKGSPLVFLSLSIACFSAGLAVFAYSSSQHYITSTITTAVSAFSFAGLIAVSSWFASERYLFVRNQGKQWLLNMHHLWETFLLHKHTFSSKDDAGRLGLSMRPIGSINTPAGGPGMHDMVLGYFGPLTEEQSRGSSIMGTSPVLENSDHSPDIDHGTDANNHGARVSNTPDSQAPYSKIESQSTELVGLLDTMSPTVKSLGHTARVRDAQFSPDGRFLATSSRDLLGILRLDNPFASQKFLQYDPGSLAPGQVAWSPNGTKVMTKLPRAIRIWEKDGAYRGIIKRDRPVQSVLWHPEGDELFSVEESDIVKLDIDGKEVHKYSIDGLQLHSVAVTSNCERFFAVGTSLGPNSTDDMQLPKSRKEKRIISFNLQRNKIESQVPILHEVKKIVLSEDKYLLVTYENQTPPQLWEVEMILDDTPILPGESITITHSRRMVARFVLRHTYMSKATTDFAGPSCFGGRKHQLILSAGKTGDIYVWDRDSGALLSHIRDKHPDGDLTCIAWNYAADTLSFVTGSGRGVVKIWRPHFDHSQSSPSRYLDVPSPITPARSMSLHRSVLESQAARRQPVSTDVHWETSGHRGNSSSTERSPLSQDTLACA